MATALFVYPLATAIAWIVSVTLTVFGPEYVGELAVGVDPSEVKWIVAPMVASEIVTVCEEAEMPPPGVNAGVAAAGGLFDIGATQLARRINGTNGMRR